MDSGARTHGASRGPWLALGILLLASTVPAGDVPSAVVPLEASADSTPGTSGPPPVDSLAALKILRANCLSCHNPDKARGELLLDSRDAMLKGGESGPALVPGEPDRSRLVQVLAPEADPHMPPKRQLTPRQIEDVRQWVRAGAPWDSIQWAALGRPRPVQFEALPPGHRPVQALALSADGTRLAVGRGEELLVYDLASTNHAVLARTRAHDDLVRSLAWSPDGTLIASGGFRELTVRQSSDLAPRWTVSSNLVGRITAVRFSPQGGAVVAADGPPGEPGWIRLFGSTDGTPLGAWPGHADTIADLAISPGGGLLATAGADRLVKVWELISRREVARYEGHVGAVLGVAFNSSASELVSVGADQQLKLWDTRTGEAVVTLTTDRRALSAVAWSADGSRVVTGDDQGRLTSFTEFKRHSGEQSSATAKQRELFRAGDALHAVAIDANGRMAYAAGEDGVIHGVEAEGKATLRLPAVPTTDPTNAVAATAPGTPSFVHDILPVLAKAGCSAGSCHAKADGQNGFKLSIFSFDPASDYAEIVKEARGRRISPAAPDESLLLLKATATVEHGGGQRFEPDSEPHALIRRWIRAGMPYRHAGEPDLVAVEVEPREGTYRPNDALSLNVRARYSDDSRRDVTHLADFSSNEKEIAHVDDHGRVRVGKIPGQGVVVARFMGLVDASRIVVPVEKTLPAEDYARLPVHNFVDRLAYDHFRRLGLFPSDLCSDAEFLRRSSLDTLGVLPTPEEARQFLEAGGPGVDSDADRNRRRNEWIERLLSRPEYADRWANVWADLLRPNPDRVGVKSVFVLDQWLRDAFRDNRPYDAMVRDILLAEGSNHRNGPIVVYRDRREPPELTTLVSQVFLGVRMECAKCHHHPNEKWSQDDFYKFAAVFGSLKQKGAGLSPPISAGTETFYAAAGGSVKHPVTGAAMRPRPPDGPDLPTGESGDPRRAFAEWLTAPGNPFFARAAVNRVWAAFFGRGFVEPVDDFRVSNPPSNPALLDALASDFAAHGYDLKHLMRTILRSRIYQLGSTPNDSNLADTRNFSRSYRRRPPAEAIADAIADITGVPDDFNGCPPGTRAMQTWSYKVNSQLLDAFGRPNSSSDCPCERDLKTSVVQALHLMNSRRLHDKLRSDEGRTGRLAASDRSPAEIVTELYLTTLSRFPDDDERRVAEAAFAAEGATRRSATEDVLWALLNSAEFLFNH